MINLNLGQYNLLQDIPSSFTIDEVRDTAVVTIFLNGESIYSTSLFQHNGVVTFYDLRGIIEQYMLDNGLSVAMPKITALRYGGTDIINGEMYILFCNAHNTEEIAENFFQYKFLSTRSYYVIPRTAYQRIAFFDDGQDSVTVFAECIFLKDGERTCKRVTMNTYEPSHPTLHAVLSHPRQIAWLARRQFNEDCGKLLTYTIHAGHRSMTYYVIDEEPEITFCFRNCFNAEEYLFVYGTTNYKTTIDRQEAVCQGRHSFYNQSVERRHEVTTAPLSMEEAHWYNELFVSPRVTVEMSADFDEVPVLISDITSEISNRPDEKIRMKFSWWFDDNSRWIDTSTYGSVFNNVFIDTFQ